MDSTSETSVDDITTESGRSCSTCSFKFDATSCDSTGCCAKDIIDKLKAQLKEKEEQLEENKKANEVGRY
jgi:hypothetical protein